jgi:formate hydrogenlyase subunit 4
MMRDAFSEQTLAAAAQICVALLAAPILLGIVNRVKAVVAGRRGSPLLQAWYDIGKLLGKSAVYSRTTGWIFRAGPVVGLAAMALCVGLLPWAGARSFLSFDGDLVLLAGLLALSRFMTIAAALDTGSAFEGMGGSREAWFSSLGEPALLLGLAAIARTRGSISLSSVLAGTSVGGAAGGGAVFGGAAYGGAVMFLVAGALFIVFLAENARIPVDDPHTHLELTMIHEVMVLDHGGVDLAYIQYGASLKLWVLGGMVVALVAPRTGSWYADLGVGAAGLAAVSVITGVVESIMARLRLVRVPQLLVAALAMSALGLALALMNGPSLGAQ